MTKLLDLFTPTNYKLSLRINRHEETIIGEAIISGLPYAREIKLDAKGLIIETVRSGEDNLLFTLAKDVITITLPDDQALEEEISLYITWRTTLNHDMQSCYLSTYEHNGKEERIAATQFESHYARECFPCLDEPAAKATFDLALTVEDFEDGDIVLANTPLAEQNDKTFVFEQTPRMSTYLLAWVIGKFHSVSTTNANDVAITTYGTLNHPLESLEFANDTAARALEYYDTRFGLPYPLPKLDQVALPDFEAGAMENWGLVTYRESMMLADPSATLATKCSVALTVTHELSHQWFGDLVTMRWWDDLWLNESFASVMEYFCTDALYPDFHCWQDFFTSDCLAALRRDSLPGVQAVMQPVSDPAEIATLFDGAIVYAKGARLVLMLIRLMSEEKFNRGLVDYFEKHQYNNTVGDDLWAALQPYAEFDVKSFMHQWISQPGYPMISADGARQQRFLTSGESDDSTWTIPEVFDDMSGHYLINLSDAEFSQKLADFDTLSLEQKLRLLLDRALLAKTPAVESSSLLELLAKFKDETNVAIWRILSTIIGDLKLFVEPESETEDNFKAFLRQTFGHRFAEISYEPLSDPDALQLRDHLLAIALYVNDESTLAALSSRYNSDYLSLDSELRSAILAAHFRADEATAFSEYLRAYQSTSHPELKSDLIFLLATEPHHSKHQSQAVALLEQPDIVRPQDHLHLYIYLLRHYRTHKAAFDWLLSHWDYVAKMAGEKSIEDYPRYTATILRRADDAERFFAFFDPLSSLPVLTRTIEIAHAEISSRLNLIASDTPGVQQKLKTYEKPPTFR